MTGTVERVVPGRRFVFIKPENSNQLVFAHFEHVDKEQTLGHVACLYTPGCPVRFDMERSDQGLKAIRISIDESLVELQIPDTETSKITEWSDRGFGFCSRECGGDCSIYLGSRALPFRTDFGSILGRRIQHGVGVGSDGRPYVVNPVFI